MAGRAFPHVVRDARGAGVGMLRYARSGHDARFEWLDASGLLVLVAQARGPGATRISDAAGRDVPLADRSAREPAIHPIGSSAVMRSYEVDGRPVWIVDDYENRSRHLVLGCAPDRFLHVHLDAQGTVILTEKTREHETLRTLRRDAAGALLEDEARVQPGETLEDVARRCGVAADALRAESDLPSASPTPGTLVRLA